MPLRMAGPLLFCMTGFSECSTPDRQEGKNYFSERAYSCSCCLSKAAFICWNACSSLVKSDISRPITVTVIAKHTARNINAAISHHSNSNTNKTTTSQLTIRVPMNKTSDLTSNTSYFLILRETRRPRPAHGLAAVLTKDCGREALTSPSVYGNARWADFSPNIRKFFKKFFQQNGKIPQTAAPQRFAGFNFFRRSPRF